MIRKRLSELVPDVLGENANTLPVPNRVLQGDLRVNIIAMGDVGTNLLMGLKLLGGDVIREIGIFDLNQGQLQRLEMEFNQMHYPPCPEEGRPSMPLDRTMPLVRILDEKDLFKCDVLIFCATKGVPQVGAQGDMRMLQLEANLSLVKSIGGNLKAYNEMPYQKEPFTGLVAVVSDPVDQLCRGMLDSSGLTPGQVRGFGLGVMAARARYYASKDDRFSSYLTEGRAFGPHGQDLVIANSIENYDDVISRELTDLAVTANMKVRDLGYKPFLAPAISSAAISILLTLRGEWNYGSVFFGSGNKGNYSGAYLGVLSRLREEGVEYEDRELPEDLYDRIKNAFSNLL